MADNPTELDIILRERAASRDRETKPTAGWTGIDRPAPREPVEVAAPANPVSAVAVATKKTRAGLWLHAVLALLALSGAAIALAAPALRPWLLATAPATLGLPAERLATFLQPETDADRALAELLPRVVGLETELLRARLETRALERRVLDSLDTGREARERAGAALEATARAEQALSLLTRENASLEQRLRAGNLMTAMLRLRRDLDTGAAMADSVSLLLLLGGFPPDLSRAIDTLRGLPDGVASMRELAQGFEALDQAISAEIGQDASGWSRLRSLFSGGDDPRLTFIQRMRDLATEGRMSEVATLLTHSPWQARAKDWIERVGARTEASLAVRSLSVYTLTRMAAAFDPKTPVAERR